MGGSCLSDSTWKKIVDIQLFPVLLFGSQMWNLDKTLAVDAIFRKGI